MRSRIKYICLLIMVLFSPALLSAREFNDGVLRYRIMDEEEATCEVIGPCFYGLEGDLEIPQYRQNEGKTYKIISIGEYAFSISMECSLTSVKLPESLRKIGTHSFSNCSLLTEIEIPKYVNTLGTGAFLGCVSLQEVNIPESVTTIGDIAFSGCDLSVVTIPASVTTIGSGPFIRCKNLKEIIVDKNNKNYRTVDGILYSMKMDTLIQCLPIINEMSIPPSVKVIGDYAFVGCDLLKKIEIPESMQKIGASAFGNCSSLTSITIPEGITNIDCFTFTGCSSLESVTFPSTLKRIEADSFTWCRSLKSLVLPESMQSLVIQAFYGTDLQSLTILADHYVGVDWEKDDYPSVSKLYVKEHLLEEYKDSFWARYAKEILPIPMDEQGGSGVENIKVDHELPFDIYNMAGMLVKSNASKENLSGLNPGVYILKQGNSSQRLMIH